MGQFQSGSTVDPELKTSMRRWNMNWNHFGTGFLVPKLEPIPYIGWVQVRVRVWVWVWVGDNMFKKKLSFRRNSQKLS